MTGKTREAGFTLLESLFQLLIAVAFLHLILLFLLFRQSVHQQLTDSRLIEWELFMVDLQHDLAAARSVSVSGGGSRFTIVSDGGRAAVEYRTVNGVIGRRIDQQGHVPLLTSVRSASFALEPEHVEVSVVLADGTDRRRRAVIGLVEE